MSELSEDEFYNSRRQREFEDRLERAFDPLNRHSLVESADLNRGGSGDAANSALGAALDALATGDDIPDAHTGPIFTAKEIDAVHEENPATLIPRDYISRYDRQILKRIALEEKLETLTPHDPRYHEVMGELSEVKRRIKIELDRSTDDTFRAREGADEYKLTIGKEERNTKRRKRTAANVMTPAEILASETPEEKKAREHKRRLELQSIRRAKKKAEKDAK